MKDYINDKQAFGELDMQRILRLVKEYDDSIDDDEIDSIIEECIQTLKDNSQKMKSREDELILKAKEVLEKNRFDEDLKMIKSHYPNETAQSVWEFDEPFFKLMLTGIVDALTAYEAYISHKKRSEDYRTPEIGGVLSNGEPVKEYYSPKDVDRLTKKDYEDPSIMQRVRKSMLRWK